MTDPEALLRELGIDKITPDASLLVIEEMLRTLVSRLNGVDPLRVVTLRQMLIDRFKAAKVTGAAKMVDTAFAPLFKQDQRDLPGQAVMLRDPELWPEPVDGALLLAELEEFITRFMVLPPKTAAMLAAFVVHTHAADLRDTATYVGVLSPTPECGKSRLLEILVLLVARAWLTVVPTTAVLFRTLDAQHPTLLLDEAEVVRGPGDRAADVRDLLHTGYRRGATVGRCVGDDQEVRQFAVFGPKVFAVVGDLPAALLSRCIRIQLRRRKRAEKIARFLYRKVRAEGERLYRQARRWVRDHAEAVRDAEPDLLDYLSDRQQETWEPLLAVAQVVGPDCYTALVKVAETLCGVAEPADDSAELLLVSDMLQIFQDRDAERLPSADLREDRLLTADLLEALGKLPDRPWATWNRGNPISAYQVAKLLKPFGIKSKPIRIGTEVGRGYERKPVEDVYERYFPGFNPLQVLQVSNDGANSAESIPLQPPPCNGPRIAGFAPE